MSREQSALPGSLIIAALCAPTAAAGTVAPMTAAVLADHAAQVVAATVADVRCTWAGDPRRIESVASLEDIYCAPRHQRRGLDDGNGSVGVTDLLALLQAWGRCP